MNPHHPEPLDNEERELAQRLARVGMPAGPSPSLDARILAAAHAAAAEGAASGARRRPRWPVAFGVAASLALAVGVAWQLRPLPRVPGYEEATGPAMDTAAVAERPSADSAAINAPAQITAPASPVEPMERGPSSAQKQTDAGRAKAAPAGNDGARAAPAAGQAANVLAAPAPAAPAPPPPPSLGTAKSATPGFVPAPPASAPSTPALESRARAEQAARAANLPSRPAATRPAPAVEPTSRDDALGDAAAAAGTDHEGFDERPPNTADAPEVRQAWLQRIRELIASGDTSTARDSLQEFKRRYPAVTLPDDLRRFDQLP